MQRITRRFIVLALALSLFGCTTHAGNPLVTPQLTATPQPAQSAFDVNNIFGITIFPSNGGVDLPYLQQAGVVWTRYEFNWSAIEPSPGERIWNLDFEQVLSKTVSSGIQPIMLIEVTPTWALKDGFACGAVAPEQFPILSKFAYDLVLRYSAPPFNVHYWELWNEPDAAGVLGCWGDPSDTQYYGGFYYGQMLQVVSPAIKQADLDAQVLVGGLLLDCDPNNPPPPPKDCTPSKFLRGILESGAGPYFDGVSFHAYDYYTGVGTYANPNWNSTSATTGPVLNAKADYLQDLLTRYGFGQKYLMNTETAIFHGPNVSEPLCAPDAPPDVELTKVYYVIQAYASALAQDLRANLWYAALGGRCAALLNADLSPKPAYYAYQFAQQELGQAIFLRQINTFPQVKGYAFQGEGKVVWVLWSIDGKSHVVSLPGLPAAVFRMGEDGKPVQEANEFSITIDLSPYFIHFDR